MKALLYLLTIFLFLTWAARYFFSSEDVLLYILLSGLLLLGIVVTMGKNKINRKRE